MKNKIVEIPKLNIFPANIWIHAYIFESNFTKFRTLQKLVQGQRRRQGFSWERRVGGPAMTSKETYRNALFLICFHALDFANTQTIRF